MFWNKEKKPKDMIYDYKYYVPSSLCYSFWVKTLSKLAQKIMVIEIENPSN